MKISMDIRPDGFGSHVIEVLKIELGEMSDFEYSFFNHLRQIGIMDYLPQMMIDGLKVYWLKDFKKTGQIYPYWKGKERGLMLCLT